MAALLPTTTSLAGTELARVRRLTIDTIRGLAMDAVQKANSGHPEMPMGMADAVTVLWTRFLKHNPADPRWPDRDREARVQELRQQLDSLEQYVTNDSFGG